ncbi:MAG: cyclodeaminase/cyclohydrolase family protein [Clostridiales bacterium]|jgi:formiminotetrahydrofolate cyclodeaminase|nr:cyclodeaminase/cyclohydrolase family protein [Clostridiales bacterium]
MSRLENLTVREFADLLGSGAPAPGGGSAAALSGALGAALLRMVAALTVGKEDYLEHNAFAEELVTGAEQLRRGFLDVMERDTEAFNNVSAVFSMPKNTKEEKTERRNALQRALTACMQTPYEMMAFALAGLELADKGMGKTNRNAASDMGVAALSLKAAVQGAWLNILINASDIKDKEFVDQYIAVGRNILEKAVTLADSIYERTLKELEIGD